MTTILKYASAAALAGALAVAATTPGEARDGRRAAAVAGFAAGAIVGAAAASNSGYAYEPSYYYGPGYAYEPGYAYAPGPVYVVPAPRYRYHTPSGCSTQGANGTRDMSFC